MFLRPFCPRGWKFSLDCVCPELLSPLRQSPVQLPPFADAKIKRPRWWGADPVSHRGVRHHGGSLPEPAPRSALQTGRLTSVVVSLYVYVISTPTWGLNSQSPDRQACSSRQPGTLLFPFSQSHCILSGLAYFLFNKIEERKLQTGQQCPDGKRGSAPSDPSHPTGAERHGASTAADSG